MEQVIPWVHEAGNDMLIVGSGDLTGSVTLGVGQFCTNPGLAIIIDDDHGNAFMDKLRASFQAAPTGTMLHAGIRTSYVAGQRRLRALDGVGHVGRDPDEGGAGNADATPALFTCDANTFKEMLYWAQEDHPAARIVIRTHPETGRRSLYVGPHLTRYVAGVDRALYRAKRSGRARILTAHPGPMPDQAVPA